MHASQLRYAYICYISWLAVLGEYYIKFLSATRVCKSKYKTEISGTQHKRLLEIFIVALKYCSGFRDMHRKYKAFNA